MLKIIVVLLVVMSLVGCSAASIVELEDGREVLVMVEVVQTLTDGEVVQWTEIRPYNHYTNRLLSVLKETDEYVLYEAEVVWP